MVEVGRQDGHFDEVLDRQALRSAIWRMALGEGPAEEALNK